MVVKYFYVRIGDGILVEFWGFGLDKGYGWGKYKNINIYITY